MTDPRNTPADAELIQLSAEIQESDNPLTQDEIRKLIEKRPIRYAHLSKYLTAV